MADERDYKNGIRDAQLNDVRKDVDVLYEQHRTCKADCSTHRADVYARIESGKEGVLKKAEAAIEAQNQKVEGTRNVLLAAMIGSNLGAAAIVSAVMYFMFRAMS